jgi:hypothetical protein
MPANFRDGTLAAFDQRYGADLWARVVQGTKRKELHC